MATIAYGIMLVAAIIVWIIVAGRGYEKIDPYFSATFLLIPIIILGYWLNSMVTTPEAAMITYCIIYLDGTLLLTLLIFAMLRTIRVRTGMWVKVIAYGAAFLHLFVVWLNINSTMYFESVTVVQTENGSVSKVVDGPLNIIHNIYLAVLVLVIACIVIAAYIKNGTYSRRTMFMYTIGSIGALLVYVAEQINDAKFTVLPMIYVIIDITILVNYDRTLAHDVSAIMSVHQIDQGSRGFVALDLKRRFLSCNEKCYEFLPELSTQRVDEMLAEGSHVARELYSLIHTYEKQGATTAKFKQGEMTCIVEISPFSMRLNGSKRGYVFDIRDATKEQHALDIMESYNSSLNEEVRLKTENIKEIQNKIVTGMANMIENRDNNTGGHVKRTSDIIKILIDEIERQGTMDISSDFAKDIVRAAPMHDLGKIVVENSILNKPGKLTDEEYAIMKTHSTKSGEMVMILLNGVEEKHFVKIAFNVARYHHERWDGRGYPDNLVGTMIPIEARIMAIVDVYDALVSKRSYKAAMSFEKVTEIMCEGMGTQFDPNMRAAFLGCKDRLEDYYRSLNEYAENSAGNILN